MTAQSEPRSGNITLGGYPWLARMIDKARLEAQGIIDDFDLEYPCPMDRNLLGQLGVDARIFQQIAVNAKTDQEILDQLKAQGVRIS